MIVEYLCNGPPLSTASSESIHFSELFLSIVSLQPRSLLKRTIVLAQGRKIAKQPRNGELMGFPSLSGKNVFIDTIYFCVQLITATIIKSYS